MVATRIVQEAVSAEVSVADLAKLAESDAGFGARVLSLVNSAAYGRGTKVADVRQACALLGVRGLRNVALGLVVGDMIPTGEDGAILLTTSLRRGVAARLVAEAVGERATDDAFTAGMFLEIGLLARARDDLAGAAQVARMPAAHRSVVERAYGFEDHATAGAKLGKEMSLPETVIEAIARHHDIAPPDARLATIAWAAERVAGAWEGGDASRIRAEARQALANLGVPAGATEDILRRLPDLVTSAATAFQRQIEQQIDLDQLAADAHAQLVDLNHGYEQLVRRLEALLKEKEQLAGDLQRANEVLATLAATDALTGLPNKRAFIEAIGRNLALADRNETNLALIVIDVDHFKQFNDTWGHQTGDLVLAKVAEVLRGCLRASDMAARFGGEEFVALLSCTNGLGAKLVAERMRAALERTTVAGPKDPLKVTASFGVAAVKGPGCKDCEQGLVGRADAALYEAKRAGRNRVVLSK